MARKPAAPASSESAPPSRERVETLHIVGEPARVCGNCQHIGAERVGSTLRKCHNLNSGRMTTTPKDLACHRAFYPDVERFPLHVRLGITAA